MFRKIFLKSLSLVFFLAIFSSLPCLVDEAGAENVSTIAKSFSEVLGLETKNLAGDVTIIMSESKDVQSTLNISSDLSQEDLDKRIQIAEVGGIIVIEDRGGSEGYGIDIPFIGKIQIFGKSNTVRTVTKTGSSVVIHSTGAKSKLKLNITVPSDATLNLQAVAGDWEILGPVKKNLKLNLSGVANVSMDKLISGAVVNSSGTGKFSAKHINGDSFKGKISGTSSIQIDSLNVDNSSLSVSGTGSINIKDGVISKELDASISGVGKIYFSGTVQDLKSRISGMGAINIGAVKGRVSESVSGMGKINIGQGS